MFGNKGLGINNYFRICYIYIYSFSRSSYPKRLTSEEYNLLSNVIREQLFRASLLFYIVVKLHFSIGECVFKSCKIQMLTASG